MNSGLKAMLPVMLGLMFAVTGHAQGDAAPAADSAAVKKAFESSREWYCYKMAKGANRIKYFGKVAYYAPKEAELFRMVKMGEAVYVCNAGGEIMEKSWENAADFPARFQPYQKYQTELDGKVKKLAQQIDAAKDVIAKQAARMANAKKQITRINRDIERRNSENRRNKNYDSDRKILSRLNHDKQTQKKIINDAEKLTKDSNKTIKKVQQEKDQAVKFQSALTKAAKAAGVPAAPAAGGDGAR